MDLCNLCHGITLAVLVTPEGYLHHKSFEALQLSAKRCPLCNLFATATLRASGPERIRRCMDQYSNVSQVDLKACDGLDFEPGRLERLSILIVYVENIGIASLSLYTDAGLNKGGLSVHRIDLRVADPAAISGVVAGRYIGLDPSSDAHLQLAAHWIENCVKNHAECSLDSTSAFRPESLANLCPLPTAVIDAGSCPLPTRVIDVGSSDGSGGPCLFETGNRRGTYATLSHCWGKSPTLTTKGVTLEDRKKGIDLSKASKTFREAIDITQRLGLQYLWIDALCIIQDSTDDWQRESSRMSNIYRDSFFTISTTGAPDGEGGCFMKRPVLPLDSVKIDCHLYDGTACKVYLRLQTDHSDTNSFYDDGQAAPVNDRAWCLQERLLSRRILHYGKEQMFWECHKHSVLEDGSQCEGWSTKRQSFDVMRTCDLSKLLETEANRVREAVYNDWRSTIKRYTARKLTQGTDKLPALSGVATITHSFTGDEYLAGLWRKDLPRELMWSASLGDQLVRPATYRAPSWSWASVDGPVEYVVVDNNDTAAVEIVDAKVEPLGHDRHGQVKAGSITICGVLVSATTAAVKGQQSNVTDIFDEAGQKIGTCTFDVEESLPRPVTCLVIPLYDRPTPLVRALVLEATGDRPEEYRRLGIGSVGKPSVAVERTTVDII